jgi:hypothetical protein
MIATRNKPRLDLSRGMSRSDEAQTLRFDIASTIKHPDSVKIKVSLDGKHIVDKCARVEMFLGSCLKEMLHRVKSNEDGL